MFKISFGLFYLMDNSRFFLLLGISIGLYAAVSYFCSNHEAADRQTRSRSQRRSEKATQKQNPVRRNLVADYMFYFDEEDLDANRSITNSFCAICLSQLRDDPMPCMWSGLSGCKHSFHSGCLYAWLERNRICPVCRASVQFWTSY